MKSVQNRLEKLETCLKANDKEEDISLLSDEEISMELAELFYKSIRAERTGAVGIVYPDVGPEVKEMSREEFVEMFISMDHDERKRLYYTPLEEWSKKEGVSV